MPAGASSDRWLLGIGVGVVALVLLSVAVTLLTDGEIETLPEGSPERAVQDYLMAVEERDYAAAYALLSADFQASCTPEAFERSLVRRETSPRVRLDEVRRIATGAEVTVRITETYTNDPIPSESSYTQRFLLEETEGGWRLREAGWPSPVCP